MARSISEIYNLIQQDRYNNDVLKPIENSSRMSIIDSIVYIVAVAIYTHEVLFDIFTVDTAKEINKHINGTKQYYINMLLKYQSGDVLRVSSDATSFYYDVEDESKRIITIASASEEEVDGYFDKHLVYKVATGSNGNYSKINNTELESINEYMSKIAFAGTNFDVVSYPGDILVPILNIVYSSEYSQSEIKSNVISAIDTYVKELSFSGKCYPSKIVERIMSIDGVVDVVADNEDHSIGFFTVKYDKSGSMVKENGVPYLNRHVSGFDTVSGYLRQSTGSGDEATIKKWSESITYTVEP